MKKSRKRAQTERRLLKTIRKQQLECLGLVMRKEGLENLTLTGKVERKRSRGRQHLTYLERLSKWMAERLLEEERQRVTGQEPFKTTRHHKEK